MHRRFKSIDKFVKVFLSVVFFGADQVQIEVKWMPTDSFARIRLAQGDEELEMRPQINGTEFGSITIDGDVLDHDVVIRLNGNVERRKKKLSKAIYGTSHIISLDEAKQAYQDGARQLIVGSGQYGNVTLSDEAKAYFERKNCKVKILSTPDAITIWNKTEGALIGLFHVTC